MRKTILTEKARQERNAYARAWRAKNKEKVKKAQADYWQRKADRTEQNQGG